MTDHPNDERAAILVEIAQQVACDIRDDLATAHRLLAQMARHDLEALACILAALVPVDQAPLPWWQALPTDPPEVIARRRQVLAEALAPQRRSAA